MSECEIMASMWELLLQIEPLIETEAQQEQLIEIAHELLLEGYEAGCEPFDTWADSSEVNR